MEIYFIYFLFWGGFISKWPINLLKELCHIRGSKSVSLLTVDYSEADVARRDFQIGVYDVGSMCSFYLCQNGHSIHLTANNASSGVANDKHWVI